jgi:hypothetical protein
MTPEVHAAPGRRLDHAITLEPLGVVFARTIGLEYERALGHVGLFSGLSATIGDLDTATPALRAGTYYAAGLTLGVRVYPWSQAPSGAFFSPFASMAWVSVEADGDAGPSTTEGWSWSAGAVAGWTWVFGRSFTLSTGLGAAYVEHRWTSGAARSRWAPATRLAVGAAF